MAEMPEIGALPGGGAGTVVSCLVSMPVFVSVLMPVFVSVAVLVHCVLCFVSVTVSVPVSVAVFVPCVDCTRLPLFKSLG